MTRLEKLFYKIGCNRGDGAEGKFLRVFRQGSISSGMPRWVVYMYKAPDFEDRQGIDFVVTTSDIGKIFIQIKSSWGGAQKFKEHRLYRRGKLKFVALVIVREADTPEIIRSKTLQAISGARRDILEWRARGVW